MRTFITPKWLEAERGSWGSVSVQLTQLLEHVVDELPLPDTQQPVFWLFLGRRRCSKVLGALLPSVRRRRSAAPRCGMTLHTDPNSSFEGRPFPIFILQSDLSESTKVTNDQIYHEQLTAQKSLLTDASTAKLSPMSFVCSQFLLPFVDVVVLFLSDYPDLNTAALEISHWLRLGSGSTRPQSTFPHLLLVAEEERMTGHFLDALATHTNSPLTGLFSDECSVTLPTTTLSPEAAHLRLKEELWHRSSDVHHERRQSRYLFSARHTQELMQHRLKQLEGSCNQVFDFVQWARHHHPVSPDLSRHLSTFIGVHNGTESKQMATITPILATALLMDHYVPGMHNFDPNEVFRTLYKSATEAAFMDYLKSIKLESSLSLVERWVAMVRRRFVACHRSLNSTSAAKLHRISVQQARETMLTSFSSETCLMCLRRVPDGPKLPCSHQICSICIQVFGKNLEQARMTFTFPGNQCLLCSTPLRSDFRVRLQPEAASLRVLSIDGGGYRGAGPIQVLLMLSRRAGVPFLARRAFDVVAGTSSGGAVIAGLFVKGWSDEECLERFEKLAHQAFQPPVHSSFLRLLLFYLCGSIYPSEPINQALKEAFGAQVGISSDNWATRHGIRVLIPITETPGNSCHLFNNYNGRLDPKETPGYQLIPASSDPVKLWEMVRATTAAPGYFPPHYIQQCDMYALDGATSYSCNGPIKIAGREAQRFRKAISYVVSLGTGSSRASSIPWRGRAIGLLADFINAQMNCVNLYQDYVHDHQDLFEQERLYRFDVDLEPEEASLDAVHRMPHIREKFRQKYDLSLHLDALVDTTIREMFIFELVDAPHGIIRKTVKGRVTCRWVPSEQGYKDWLHCVRKRRARVIVQNSLVRELIEDQNGLAAHFIVDVDAKNPRLWVQIQLDDTAPRHLAQSPFHIPDLVRQQGLHTSFGQPQFAGTKRKYSTEGNDAGQCHPAKKLRTYSLRPRRPHSRRRR